MTSLQKILCKIPGAIRYRLRRLRSKLRPARPLHTYVSRIVEYLWIERRYKLNVHGYEYIEDLNVDDRRQESVWYHPSEWLAVKRAIATHGVTRDDVFLDVGSGKGGVVFLAALSFPFKRVIGAELSEDLNRISRANVEANRGHLRCGDVELVTTDILKYPIPDDLSMVYLFSPIINEPFRAFVERLLDSLDRHPRVLRMIYNYPVEHNHLVRHGRVRVIDARPSSWLSPNRLSDETIVSYLLLPEREVPEVRAILDQAPARMKGAEAWLGTYDPGFTLESRDYTLKRDASMTWQINER